jgi:Capsule assembly protein Wzi
MQSGDNMLRHDIQTLADHGVLTGPVTTWPLSWGPILVEIRSLDSSANLAPVVSASLERVRSRAQWETRTHELTASAHLAAADSPTRIRSFSNTPRESIEIGGGLSWTGDRFTMTVQGQAVDQADGSGEARADGSVLGVAIGNYLVSANTLDRWWGPGWDGSLILSNNARSIPAFSIDRNFTDPFDSKWLSWIGPWDLAVMMGELESSRHIPNAKFFGMRFNFRPLPSLEIGLSRTAQWCGDGRPCNFSTFTDLLLGRDNLGDGGVVTGNEPGNQLAGIDYRFSSALVAIPISFYGQFIGEDEAGGFPSRFLGQIGIETRGITANYSTWQIFGEVASTTCRFYDTNNDTALSNCAYNHGIYETGYRYRSRPIGHGVDNDSLIISIGAMMASSVDLQLHGLVRFGELNQTGVPDEKNSLTPVSEKFASVDLVMSRQTGYGTVALGIGFEQIDNLQHGESHEARFFLNWRSAY